MNSFDKVIGYEAIKDELLRICDMFKHPEAYEKLGAKFPQGVLLVGKPGLGKTLMAKCFIEESGLPAYILRRNMGTDGFIEEITNAFRKAKENAPSIVLLDDLDKFANEDAGHRDAEEYVAVQAAIDEVNNAGVFVLATVNDRRKLPTSLIRAGRFDKTILVRFPTSEDVQSIMAHYLKDKMVSEDVNMEDLSKMVSRLSCAELETILNEAAISAAYARKDYVEMEDMVRAVLRTEYDSPDNLVKRPAKDVDMVALHEAGHLVASEVLCPGSVGFASIATSGRADVGGLVHCCKESPNRRCDIITALAGKAAVELYYSETVASGCQSDISTAVNHIRDALSGSGTCGFGMVEVTTPYQQTISESYNARCESVIQAELERYYFKAKDLLLKNRGFLEKAAAALKEKNTLLYSDIQQLRSEQTITPVAA